MWVVTDVFGTVKIIIGTVDVGLLSNRGMFLNIELLEKVHSLPIWQFEGNRRLGFSLLIKFYHLYLLVFTFDSLGVK